MVRPPHLPPIGNEEAKRKWKQMNRPSISRLFFPKKRKENLTNNYMPIYNPHTYNKQRTHNKQHSYNDNNDYQKSGSIIKYIVLTVIIITLLVFFWWILIPIGVILGIYLLTKKS